MALPKVSIRSLEEIAGGRRTLRRNDLSEGVAGCPAQKGEFK
jgi:hypothetical protein